ncbi:hypothetical protein CYMTET_8536 [Cymbomonas tetramitiformis]|uniref:Glycosyltransferase 2-like domain-containing protein n=1 Tax=Cymbomonas tetramitiformis TaxID=36881 RepID=A0AAE0LFQ7_9CHLO|nr:hypothetical protein CYMTET_8536 [Cymbomonas tetramitiformis]
MRNAQQYLGPMLQSIVGQTYKGNMELCVYDDGSTDDSRQILEGWRETLCARGVQLVITPSPSQTAGGCGKGRNVAVQNSKGSFLCFLDADDIMAPRRVEAQLEIAQRHQNALVGSRVWRNDEATPRYTRWLNTMTQDQLYWQRLREVTLCQPTWFCSRAVFHAVDGYVEDHANQAEDMIFLYKHVANGGALIRADEELLFYRFHAGSVTGQRAVSKDVIWGLRVAELERLLATDTRWCRGFTIWWEGNIKQQSFGFHERNPKVF